MVPQATRARESLLHGGGRLWYNVGSKFGSSEFGGCDVKTGEIYPKSSCTLDAWVEHIVHIDGFTGSSPVATTPEPNRKVRLNLHIEKMDTENCPYVLH